MLNVEEVVEKEYMRIELADALEISEDLKERENWLYQQRVYYRIKDEMLVAIKAMSK